MSEMKKKIEEILNLVSLENKYAVVTGAGGGIGEAIAEILGKAGAKVFLVDLDEIALKKVKGKLDTMDINTEYFILDLSKKSEIEKFWSEIDPIPNILINNVGVYPLIEFTKLDEKNYNRVMQINLESYLWMSQSFIKANMRLKKGGIIVNIASIEAILPFQEHLTHYAISKAGVIALTRSLARDYGKKGFRVNAILPGGIVTKGTKNVAKKILHFNLNLLKSGYDFISRLPLKRAGKPIDIAKMVLALVSDLASYVQGAVIPVDGGFLSA